MADPVLQNHHLVRLPYTNIEFALNPLDKKVMATALACIMFFGVQMCFSWPITTLITCTITTITFIFEQAIDRESPDWFSTEINWESLVRVTSVLILKPFLVYVLFSALGLPSFGVAQEGIKRAFFKKPIKMGLIICVCAPFSEEILFRGVLEERIQDFGHLLNRYTALRISQRVRDIFASIAQSLIFGACHLNREIKKGMESTIFIAITFLGYIFSRIKERERSLVPAIAVHSANNIGAVIHMSINC